MKIKLKKILATALTAMLMIATVSCGSSVKTSKNESESTSTESTSAENVDLGKVLIVYYSYTGNTKKLTENIKAMTNADVVEIEPVTPYSDDYDTVEDQAKKEEDDNFMPDIKTKVDNIDSYDYILIGSPIWWYQIAPPVKTLLSQTDLSNKNVALFVTHGGWGLGQSEDNIKELCPNSKILDSLAIEGEKVSESNEEVVKWLKSLK